MNEKKSYKVHIFEEHYTLLSDEPEELVLNAAEMVNCFMKEISCQSAIVDQKKIAVLAALRIANQLLTFENIYNKEQKGAIDLIRYIDEELSV